MAAADDTIGIPETDPALAPLPNLPFRLTQWAVCLALLVALIYATVRWWTVGIVVDIAIIASWLVGVWVGLYVLFCWGKSRRTVLDMRLYPSPPELYANHGLGPVSTDDPRRLYLDLMKRAVINVLYEDVPIFFYNHKNDPRVARGFNLSMRLRGEDGPTAAHSMIGLHRLNNIEQCIETVLAEEIPGDLIETGSYLGGATIFMRAVLKAHGIKDRRVIACDAFSPLVARKTPLVVRPILAALASIRNPGWRRRFFDFLQQLPDSSKAFPPSLSPTPDWIDFVMWNLQHPVCFNAGSHNSLELVRSHFARYGLLDEQVVLLQGFFSETLPNAPVDQIAIMRLDGDTYESTMDALAPLYDKLSPGGFCIIDDFWAFEDCRIAVEEFREQRGIRDELVAVDNLAVYWRKGSTSSANGDQDAKPDDG